MATLKKTKNGFQDQLLLNAGQKYWSILQYTRQKKKHTTTIFPLRSPFNTKMLIVMKYSFLIKFYYNFNVT